MGTGQAIALSLILGVAATALLNIAWHTEPAEGRDLLGKLVLASAAAAALIVMVGG